MNLSKNNTKNFWKYWPEKKTLTLKPKSFTSMTADQFSADVACITCRQKLMPQPNTVDGVGIVNVYNQCVWEIWDRGQTAPRPGDTLVDEDGVSWVISNVDELVFGNLYSCLSVKYV